MVVQLSKATAKVKATKLSGILSSAEIIKRIRKIEKASVGWLQMVQETAEAVALHMQEHRNATLATQLFEAIPNLGKNAIRGWLERNSIASWNAELKKFGIKKAAFELPATFPAWHEKVEKEVEYKAVNADTLIQGLYNKLLKVLENQEERRLHVTDNVTLEQLNAIGAILGKPELIPAPAKGAQSAQVANTKAEAA